MKKAVSKKLLSPAPEGYVYDSKKWVSENAFCNTADIVLLSVKDDELAVLLIKRKEWPFNGCWALPGGFINGQDTVKAGKIVKADIDAEAAAMRELEEETGLKGIFLEELKSFTTKGRDPREDVANLPVRVFSIAHLALIDHTKVNAVAGSDAEDVKWFNLSKLPPLAFDHDKIIDFAVNRVRNRINYTNVGFELVPKKFTIPELQSVFEKVIGKKLDRNNFRTKILKLGILNQTKDVKKEGRGKPTAYYSLNYKKLLKIHGDSLF